MLQTCFFVCSSDRLKLKAQMTKLKDRTVFGVRYPLLGALSNGASLEFSTTHINGSLSWVSCGFEEIMVCDAFFQRMDKESNYCFQI